MPEDAPVRKGIHWFEWKPESFKLARLLDHPILLDLTAVWCHWCREMEETSYTDPEVVKLASELFVPIRVDVDRRPDISERYNFGGFPTTAILTPDGETITGGTYMPPEELKLWLLSQSAYFKAQRDEIRRRLANFSVDPSSAAQGGELSSVIVKEVQQCLIESFDRVYGGFGTQPKFPLPDALDLAMLSSLDSADGIFRRITTKTLDEMTIGGLFDRVEGGFHRYSTTRDWGSPHFEKLLDGNASLLRNYIRAYKLTGLEKYKQVGERTVAYLLVTLRDPDVAAFYGSQSADEEYYKLSKDERLEREPPPVDKTFFTDWNARTIISLLEAASVLREGPELVSLCEKAADFLLTRGLDEEKGMHHYLDPSPGLTGLLADNLGMAESLLELYMVTGDAKNLDGTQRLASFILKHFWDSRGSGGFYDRVEEEGAEGDLRRPEKSPHENSLAAEFLLKLSAVTDNDDFKEVARKALGLFAASYSELGLLASCYARSVELAINGPVRIEIIGSRADYAFKEFLRAASSLLEPRCVVLPCDVEEDRERIRRLRAPPSRETYALVCTDFGCSRPVREPSKLAETVAVVPKKPSDE